MSGGQNAKTAGLFGAGLGLLGGLFGGGNNGDAARLEQIKKIYQNMALRTDPAYMQQLLYSKQALGAIRQGYGGALNELSRVGGQARSDALGRQEQQIANATQSSISRGTYGTGQFDAARSGIIGETERGLASLDSQLAGLKSGLMMQGAQAQANALYNIGGVYPQWAGARNQQSMSLASLLSGVQDQGSTGLSQGIGTAGQLASLALMFA